MRFALKPPRGIRFRAPFALGFQALVPMVLIGLVLIGLVLVGADPPPVEAQSRIQSSAGPIEAHVRSLQRQFDLLEPTRRAWISTDWGAALRTAQERDRSSEQSDNETSPLSAPNNASTSKDSLFGLVVGVKDNIDVAGFATTAGSKRLSANYPKGDATVIRRLRDRGVIIAGKTNLDTFARGVRSLSEVRGQTTNAWDVNRAAGGSSGGSAVAVASEMADAALGTDTCGSLRYPATYNGIYSLRPTWGRLSRNGVVPLSPSQDTIGPMARTPIILRLLFEAMVGPDSLDPATSASVMVPRTSQPTKPYRIGVLKGFGSFVPQTDPRWSLNGLPRDRVEVVTVSLPKGVSNASLIEAEGDASLGSYQQWIAQTHDLTSEVAPWLMASWKPTNGRWRTLKAQQQRNAALITELLDRQHLDAIAYPTTPFAAAVIGKPQPSANCWLSATSGLPALAIPGGFNDKGFPLVGIDLLGRALDESTLLDIAEISQAHR
jgi:amidase